MSLLTIDKLTMRFGGLTAVDNVDLQVDAGKIVSVIGPNGAGKTTLFNAITGIYEPTDGAIRFAGRQLRRAVNGRVLLLIAAIALTTGLATALISMNVDELWTVTIKQHYDFDRNTFDASAARRQLDDYISDPTYGRSKRAWIALAIGSAIGAFGTFVVWNRSRRTPDFIALAGIARTFQNIRLFANMTVLENVLVGLDRKQSRNVLRMMLRTPGVHREENRIRRQAFDSLKFVGLDSKANALANSLAYGDQRRLEIARAMATDPKLLLLDEPAAGMNPAESVDLMQLIRKIRDRGITVLLIEHHMNVVMGISDQIAVLDYGKKIADGAPEAVRSDPRVIEAYLGKESE